MESVTALQYVKAKEQDCGFISGRAVSTILKAAKLYGIPESELRKAKVSMPYEFYLDKHKLFLWNDFVEFVRCMYDYYGSEKDLKAIGNTVYKLLDEVSYVKWLKMALTLRMAIKISYKYTVGYNFPNCVPTVTMEDDVCEVSYAFKHDGDYYYGPAIYIFVGIKEMYPTIFGYDPMKVEYRIDELKRVSSYKMHLPKRRSLVNTMKHFFGIVTGAGKTWSVLKDHEIETNNAEEKRIRDLNTLHGLIQSISDPVMIVRGDELVLGNQAFHSLAGGDAFTHWGKLFEDCQKIRDFLDEISESHHEGGIDSHILRSSLPSVEVELHVLTARRVEGENEALIKVLEKQLPSSPAEAATIAREQERKSIARDMHDSLGQLLTAASFQLAALEHSEADSERAAKLSQVSQLVREITLFSRSFTRQMDLLIGECNTIYEGLSIVVDEFSVISGVSIRNHAQPHFEIAHPDAVGQLCYVFQEALNNAFRHGHATEVVINTIEKDRFKIIQLSDNGSGIGDSCISRAGIGIRSMEYRVTLLGGELSISDTGKGTLLEMKFKEK